MVQSIRVEYCTISCLIPNSKLLDEIASLFDGFHGSISSSLCRLLELGVFGLCLFLVVYCYIVFNGIRVDGLITICLETGNPGTGLSVISSSHILALKSYALNLS